MDKDLLGAKKTKEKFPDKYLKYCIREEIDLVIIWYIIESWWDNIDISPRYNKHHKEELTGGEEWTERELVSQKYSEAVVNSE